MLDDKIVVKQEIRGFAVKTKEHAKELYVSPGHLITRETARDMVINTVKPPHKLPEPLHIAQRYAKKIKLKLIEEKKVVVSV